MNSGGNVEKSLGHLKVFVTWVRSDEDETYSV